jgi:hypothetical protein
MKKIRSISISALLVIALATVVIAKVNAIATVQNNTPNDLGVVAVYVGSTPFYVNVPGPGAFNVNVPSTPTSVVVNNYVVMQGQYGIVILRSGVKVKVTLSGDIVVTDQTIVQ